MKLDWKIIGSFLSLGLVVVIGDVFVDSIFFYEATFWDQLFFEIPPVELYMRLLVVGLFFISGLLASSLVSGRRVAEERLAHLNQVLRGIRDVSQLIAREEDRDRLLEETCRILVGARGYHNAFIALVEDGRPLEPFFHHGFDGGFGPMEELLRAGKLPLCAARVLETGEGQVLPSPKIECGTCPNIPAYDGRSGLAAPLVHGDRVFGWVTVTVPRDYIEDPEERELLEELGENLGLALWTLDAEARSPREVGEAHKAVRESEERFRDLAELLPEAVFEADLEVNLTYANQKAFQFLGYTQQDFKAGLNGLDMLVPEDRERARAMMAQRFQGKDPGGTEYTAQRKDGTTFPVLFHASTILREGRPAGLRGVIVDMSERKRAEEELVSTNRRMANLMASSPMGIHLYELTPGGDLVFMGGNPAADRLTGVDNAALAGRTIEEAFPGLAETEVPTWYREIALGGPPRRMPRIPYDSEGIKGIYEVVAFQTAPREMAVLFHDITEQEQAAVALQESEERFRSVIEQSNDAIYLLFENRFDLVNQRFCDLLGVTPEEVRSPEFDFRALVAPSSLSLIQERAVMRSRGETVPSVYPFDVKTKAGEILHVEASVAEIEVRGGSAVLGVLRDITGQKALEAQLLQSQKMESVGRLSGGIAHDLNNLLTPILGFGEMLVEDLELEAGARDSATEIVRAAFRARDLVRQLLAFGRRQTLEVETFNLNGMLEDFEPLLRRTIREDVHIELKKDRSLPLISGDRGQIEQVVMNLVINARDAMPEGGTLVIETQEEILDEAFAATHLGGRPGRYAVLAITDTGVGMDPETQARVFEPFFTTKEVGSGTGLGLSMVYGIVKQHEGNIWVHSEPGRGSVFRCYFPAEESRGQEEEVGEEQESVPGGPETVMVVEDEELVRTLTVTLLKRHGYTVIEAGDAKECLSRLQDHEGPLDLLLTDVVMPGMNGRDLYREASIRFPSLKVLFMSGYSKDVVSHQGVLDEGISFLQKPFSVHALVSKVREVLDQD